MGKNMVLNLKNKRYSLVVYDKSFKNVDDVKSKGILGVYSIKEMAEKNPKHKIIWLMINTGKAVDDVIIKLMPYLSKGDVVIDGGNSYYKDSIRRYKILIKKGIDFLDVGTSGGIKGARYGACMMIGGDYNVFKKIEVIFKDMCVKNGYGYVGKAGAGHFVKMVHNGIEYGMMASIAEGFDVLRKSDFKINLKDVAKVYSNGSIVEGRLMSFLLDGMNKKDFRLIKGKVSYGETENEMKKLANIGKMKILKDSILMRAKTRLKSDFKGKIISVLRKEFGGHSVKK